MKLYARHKTVSYGGAIESLGQASVPESLSKCHKHTDVCTKFHVPILAHGNHLKTELVTSLYECKGIYYIIYVFLFHFPGCIAVAGDGCVPGSVADAAELSSASEMAEGARERSRKNHKASPRLPSVAHHRPHQRLPHRHPSEIPQGDSPLHCYLKLKRQSLIFCYLIFF